MMNERIIALMVNKNDFSSLSLILGFLAFFIPEVCPAQNDNSDSADTGKVIELFLPYEKEQHYYSYKQEVGLDVTGILAQLTPFNTVKAPVNPVGMKLKKYAKNFAFRISFGFDLQDADLDLAFAYMAMGYERRRPLGKSFAYNSGWEAIFHQEPGTGDLFFGAGNFHGIDYNFNKTIFLGIEAQLRLLFSEFTGPSFKFIPPTAVFLNVRF